MARFPAYRMNKKPLQHKLPPPPVAPNALLGKAKSFVPDQSWAQLIEMDPVYGQKKADNLAASAAGAAERARQVRQAFIELGMTPNLAGMNLPPQFMQWLNEDIDQSTKDLAGSNTSSGLSLAAQLERQHKDNLLAQEDIRAARGILSSGQSGFEVGRENLRNTSAMNDAVQALLGYISGQYGGFAEAESGRASELGGFAEQVMARLLESGDRPRVAPNPFQRGSTPAPIARKPARLGLPRTGRVI
jgi:hypothetical protein